MGSLVPRRHGSKLLYLIIAVALIAIILAGVGLLLMGQDDETDDQGDFDPGLMVSIDHAVGPGRDISFLVEVRQDPIMDRSNITDVIVADSLNGSVISLVDADHDGYNDGDLNRDQIFQYDEVWTYNITYTIPNDAKEPLENSVNVTGKDGDGDVISGQDFEWVMFMLRAGDSFKFQYTGSVEGTMWINVTGTTENSYVCSVIFFHDNITEEPGPWYFEAGDLISPFGPNPTANWWERDLVGTEDIVTALGERTVRHYHNTTTDSSWDMYTALDMNVMYRYVRTMENNPLLVELVETNVDRL